MDDLTDWTPEQEQQLHDLYMQGFEDHDGRISDMVAAYASRTSSQWLDQLKGGRPAGAPVASKARACFIDGLQPGSYACQVYRYSVPACDD